jgi:hypothetical protein
MLRLCQNNGDITGGTTTGEEAISSTGGLLGFGYATGEGYGIGYGEGMFTLELCTNTGTITGGEAATTLAFSYTGGILGYGDGYGYGDKLSKEVSADSYGTGVFTLISSANRGVVKGGEASDKNALASTGGVLGYASASAFTSGEENEEGHAYGTFNMRNCYSYANISAKKGVIGGLAGSLANIGNGKNHRITTILTDSYATGSVNQQDTIFGVVAGGIAGRIQKSKDSDKLPQIANCLAALRYLNGDVKRTYRIVGQIQGISPPFTKVLGKNYAYIFDGVWVDEQVGQNGLDWGLSMDEPPISTWDFKNKVWVLGNSQTSLPLLNRLPNQTAIPIPYY